MERDHQTTLPVVLIIWCLSVGSISGVLARESQVIGSPQPIVAVAGDDVILPCSLKPPINAEKLTVVWFRPDLDPEYVHVYKGGSDSVGDQNPSYRSRTSLFEGELKNGNVSLKLFRVKLEDQGNYTCFSPTNSQVEEAVIHLIVGSSSKQAEPSSDSSPSVGDRVWIGVGVGVGVLVLVLVIVGVFFYCRHQKKSTQPAGSNAFFYCRRRKKSPQPADSNDPEREEHSRQNITYHSVPGGPREGEDRGLASEAESNANSDRDSLAAEHIELSTFRSDG